MRDWLKRPSRAAVRGSMALCLILAPVAASGAAEIAATPAGESPPSQASLGFGESLNDAALARTKAWVLYDPAYRRIAYPGGDVPANRGVCSDVVIRAYRALGIDLQRLVHEDMHANFEAYPKHWGLSRPDPNIDHRRVPNLETFFRRRGAALPPSEDPRNYRPGDLVAWNLRGPGGFLPHIGIVTDRLAPSGRPKIVHNIGAGPALEDVLFKWQITGHYRYRPAPD